MKRNNDHRQVTGRGKTDQEDPDRGEDHSNAAKPAAAEEPQRGRNEQRDDAGKLARKFKEGTLETG